MLIACRKKNPKKPIQLPCPRSFQQIRHIHSELAPFFLFLVADISALLQDEAHFEGRVSDVFPFVAAENDDV